MIKKLWNINTLLYLALVLALGASLKHVAYAFSTVNGGDMIEAYVSAIAIDLGLLALAVGINKRKAHRRSTWSLWLGVLGFSTISTFANWLSGVVHVAPVVADVSQIGHWLIGLRPILLSGVLPILVIYLSEIVSEDYQVHLVQVQLEARKAQRAIQKVAQMDRDAPYTPDIAIAQEAKQNQIAERRNQLLQLKQAGRLDEMTQVELANELGVSVATVKRDLVALNGKVRGDNRAL